MAPSYLNQLVPVSSLHARSSPSAVVIHIAASGVARVLRAPVQRHVMGPLVTKQLSKLNSLAARTAVTSPVDLLWR